MSRRGLSPQDAEAFEVDSSYPNITIADGEMQLWQRFLDHVRSRYRLRYRLDSENADMPPRVEEIFRQGETQAATLAIWVDDLQINCFFFLGEINLDVDPSEVRVQRDVDRVKAFMIELGDLLEREVIMTPEGLPEQPIYRYRPGDRAPEYFPRRPQND